MMYREIYYVDDFESAFKNCRFVKWEDIKFYPNVKGEHALAFEIASMVNNETGIVQQHCCMRLNWISSLDLYTVELFVVDELSEFYDYISKHCGSFNCRTREWEEVSR